MDFQLAPVPNADEVIDEALKQGRKRADHVAQQLKAPPEQKRKGVERERIGAIQLSIAKQLDRITRSFPSIDGLNEFYARLVEETLDPARLKQSLAAIAWARRESATLARELKRSIKEAETRDAVLKAKKGGVGRLTSIVKQVAKNLDYLREARDTMRGYPSIKEGFVVAIAGFPNVGKSTLLRKLTTSTPEVNSYAFTTKRLNVGSVTIKHHDIQFIDTPGTLAREHMNRIEQLAELAMRYAADAIIYIYDLSEPYPLDDQRKLERKIRELGKPVLIYLSKTDVLPEKVVATFMEEGMHTSPETLTEELKQYL